MDAEKGITEDPSSRLNTISPSPEAKRKSLMCRRQYLMFSLCCASLVITIAIVIIILAFTVFKKKDPTITVNDITITGVSPDIDLPSLSIDFNITLSVNSTVYNPNRASFKHYPGTVDIFYREADIGYVIVEEGTIPERGSEEVMSNVTLTVDSFGQMNLTEYLIRDLLGGEIKFDTTARIPGKVTILGFVKVNIVAKSVCHIVVGIPTFEVKEQKCSS
ncbi:harpin-induced like protein 29 [Zostera marina]|uniref:Harpin-induced like protein 29 n=1 Tax=Zostera marina TaxID=29655 RepID=A0A0K9P962_ZOSMR|nr:harpin-induced like protein 29 [Zostera marina]